MRQFTTTRQYLDGVGIGVDDVLQEDFAFRAPREVTQSFVESVAIVVHRVSARLPDIRAEDMISERSPQAIDYGMRKEQIPAAMPQEETSTGCLVHQKKNPSR